MTNYKLEEFKAWLEEKEERKANLPKWPEAFSHWENLARIKGWSKYATIVKQWKAQVDHQRERERERERAKTKWGEKYEV